MKVLLVQLPVPDNRFTNLPLALGYLKAMADAAHFPGVEVRLLEAPLQNRAGDALLLDSLLAHDPDLIGFSLYTWNSSRALSLARALKKRAPEILLVGGGPEVNYDGDWVLSSPDFDFLVQGEGERTFVELLAALNKGVRGQGSGVREKLAGSRGLGVRTDKGLALNGGVNTLGWQFGPAQPPLEDVNLVPSAYLSGALEGHLGRFISIELSRWCPSKCTFCYYGRQDLPRGGKRYFDLERIRQEILFGLEHGVEQVHFVEANFNTLPHLPQLYDLIQETGANRRLNFYAELRGEAIDTAQARRLAECNFGTVEVGLQSAVPEVMARVRRKNHLPRLVQGVHNLRAEGIEVFLDVILGLPGETPQTFQQTLDFMAANNLAPFDLFHLQILSGTQLKAEALAGQHGLRWQPAPPYYVLETAELSFEKLVELRRGVLASKGIDPTQVAGLPQPGPFVLTEPIANQEDAPDTTHAIIERVVLDLTGPEPPSLAPDLARRLGSEVAVWLKLGQASENGLNQAVELLQTLSAPNLTGQWQLFVQANRPLSRTEQRLLVEAIQHEEGYLNRLAVFAQAEQPADRPSRWASISFFQVIPSQLAPENDPYTIAQVNLAQTDTVVSWRNQLEAALATGGAGVYLVTPAMRGLPARWKATVAGLELPPSTHLWLSDWGLAAGLAAATAEDSAEILTNLDFPLTAHPGAGQPAYSRPAKAQLERAAIAYQLAQPLAPANR